MSGYANEYDHGTDINSPKYVETRPTIVLEHCHVCDKYFLDGDEVSIYSYPEDEYLLEIEEEMCLECQNNEIREQLENQ